MSEFAHTVVLPGLRVDGHELHFFCDLTRPNALAELLATCDTWLDLSMDPTTRQSAPSEDACYDWAAQKMHASLLALNDRTFRQQVLARVTAELLEKHQFPDVKAALEQYYHADFAPLDLPASQATRLH